MKFNIITIFPKIISDYCDESILKRAQKKKLIKIKAINLRDFTTDKHHKVDDTPYGGGPGMILKVEPIYKALKSIKALRSVIPAKAGIQKKKELDSRLRGNDKTKIIILDPAGKKFDQKMAKRFSKLDELVLICGRYEGFDERVYKFADEKISIGDYVLAGGELPALVVMEAVARLLPGVVGNPDSLDEETFNSVIPAKAGIQKRNRLDSCFRRNDNSKEFVEYPQYTRPENFMGKRVPKILLSGNHKKIEEWRGCHPPLTKRG